MAIAHQTEVVGAANTAAGNYDTNITPAAAPNGVCVVIHQNTTVADSVTSVIYGTGAGSVTLTRSRFDTEATEAGGVYLYWGGDGAIFPSGTQTVRIARTGTHRMQAVISTMTVTAGQQVQVDSNATGGPGPAVNPTWTHTSLVNNVMAYLGFHSGTTSITNTPAANWTGQSATDLGLQGCGFARLTSATNTAGNRAPGWTEEVNEDFVGSSIAFKEGAPPAAPSGPPILVMAPPQPV
jgi:hypothetical protein